MILYSDEHIVVVDKPAGMPVHRSRLVNDGDVYLIDVVRGLIDGPLHLIHRLDRATSGVLLIGRSAEIAGTLGRQFMQREVEKTYLAVCRGWPEATGEIDYPLPGVMPLFSVSYMVQLGLIPASATPRVKCSPASSGVTTRV